MKNTRIGILYWANFLLTRLMIFALAWFALGEQCSAETRPNVLFIAVDDLNDWTGCLQGHPQARTPNLDRLAKSGVLFTNAHCPASSCNPSRTAIMSGISPAKSGIYNNRQPMRGVLPENKLLPTLLRDNGYHASGSGKILHYFIDARSWDKYFPKAETENPFPRTLYPEKRPVSLPRAGEWQYDETDWGPLEATDEEFGGDHLVAKWVGEQLAEKQDKPFFLACGFYRPHEPWFVPRKYFEPFPLETIQLPPGYKADDIDDLPAEGKRLAQNRYFEHITAEKQWKQGIQGYLASIYFMDTMLGKVLDSLENGPHKDNTIVVLWSDHGWHLGEKQHWQKYTAWRACTRIPLIIRVPSGCSTLAAGTPSAVCAQPVNLVSLLPTILELTNCPLSPTSDGPSLLPLLKNPEAAWEHVSITYLDRPGSLGLSAKDWRYIRYSNGEEELYHTSEDPYEWTNLATNPKFQETLERYRKLAPQKFAPLAESKVVELKLQTEGAPPKSQPQGEPAKIDFHNNRDDKVRIYWISPTGERKLYAELEPKKTFSQSIRQGAVWLVTDAQDQSLGFLVAPGKAGRVAIGR